MLVFNKYLLYSLETGFNKFADIKFTWAEQAHGQPVKEDSLKFLDNGAPYYELEPVDGITYAALASWCSERGENHETL